MKTLGFVGLVIILAGCSFATSEPDIQTVETCTSSEEYLEWFLFVTDTISRIGVIHEGTEQMTDAQLVARATNSVEETEDIQRTFDSYSDPPQCAKEAHKFLRQYVDEYNSGWEALSVSDFDEAELHFEAALNAVENFQIELFQIGE